MNFTSLLDGKSVKIKESTSTTVAVANNAQSAVNLPYAK